jgi:Long-chain acyl-CoA synthetases (AMP-forming)
MFSFNCWSTGKIVFQSTGPRLYGVEMKLHNINENGVGEIIVRGPNVMKGYYKDEARTKAAFLEDGWFRTKDLGSFDKKGNLFIRGRVDNMLIGANGENIYPEEIESIINDNDFVLESLVVKEGDRLVAKVHFNYEQIASLIDFKVIDAEIRNSIGETMIFSPINMKS